MGTCTIGMRKTHDRTDPTCRLSEFSSTRRQGGLLPNRRRDNTEPTADDMQPEMRRHDQQTNLSIEWTGTFLCRRTRLEPMLQVFLDEPNSCYPKSARSATSSDEKGDHLLQ